MPKGSDASPFKSNQNSTSYDNGGLSFVYKAVEKTLAT